MQQEDLNKLPLFPFLLAAVWLLSAALLIFHFWPNLPETDLGWLLLVVVGAPAYVAAEGLFGWLFSEKLGRKISAKQFSLLRVALGAAVVTTVFAVGFVVLHFFNQ